MGGGRGGDQCWGRKSLLQATCRSAFCCGLRQGTGSRMARHVNTAQPAMATGSTHLRWRHVLEGMQQKLPGDQDNSGHRKHDNGNSECCQYRSAAATGRKGQHTLRVWLGRPVLLVMLQPLGCHLGRRCDLFKWAPAGPGQLGSCISLVLMTSSAGVCQYACGTRHVPLVVCWTVHCWVLRCRRGRLLPGACGDQAGGGQLQRRFDCYMHRHTWKAGERAQPCSMHAGRPHRWPTKTL